MRILFVMRHPQFVRYYEPAIELLAQRGHHICLAFPPLHHKRNLTNVQIDRLTQEYPAVTRSEVPERQDWWSALANQGRAIQDYLRYFHPRYCKAEKMIERTHPYVGWFVPFVFRNVPGLKSRCMVQLITWLLRNVEAAIPSSPIVEQTIQAYRADVLLLTPLVDFGSKQLDYVKAARTRGVPVGVCVASWDNLTNKGVIQLEPDMVILWNETQKREATELHGITKAEIRVTGAQCFDEWFARQPSLPGPAFCEKVGLSAGHPFLLYLCSSRSIAPNEVQFIRRWLAALRAQPTALFRRIGVLIRPHPLNARQWEQADLSAFGNVTVWPKSAALVTDEQTRATFFDSIHHSSAVVGINTSALIEAGIVGRVCHTVLAPEFADTQDGTLHFDYLVRSGYLKVSRDFAEHFQQLSQTLENPPIDQARIREFLTSFVRPQGLDKPSTPLVVEAIEKLGRAPAAKQAPSRWNYTVRLSLYPLLLVLWVVGQLWVVAGWLCRAIRSLPTRFKRHLERGRQVPPQPASRQTPQVRKIKPPADPLLRK